MLEELEAVGDVALVGYKQQSSLQTFIVGTLISLRLGGRDFWSKLDAATQDTTRFRRNSEGEQITSWIGLACVGGEGASGLACRIVDEVVVASWIWTQDWVIPDWCQIHWGSWKVHQSVY